MMPTKKQWMLVLGLSAIMTGCNNEKDYYQNPLDNLKPIDEYFDFATRDRVTVSLDMGTIGANSTYEVYTENPMKALKNGEAQLNRSLSPVYSNVTDEKGKSNVSLNLPTAAKKIWVFNRNWNLPTCIELDITNKNASYAYKNAATAKAKSVRGYYVNKDDGIEYGKDKVENGVLNPITVDGITNLFCLCDWKYDDQKEEVVFTPDDYVKMTLRDPNEVERFANLAAQFFPEQEDNSEKVLTPDEVQIKTSDKEEYTNINLVFLKENAFWHSCFGYYYYKAGTTPDMDAIHKYIIMPDASEKTDGGMFSRGETIHLQFFGENYDQEASYNFPKGYIVGWFIIANGITYDADNHTWTINASNGNGFGTSLEKDSNGKCKQFAVATDADQNKLFIGVEDNTDEYSSDKDFNDLCFYVEATPSVIRPDIPIIEDIEKNLKSEITGTYAFEDQWPDGGDYDLNDVVTEYKHVSNRYIHQKVEDGHITLNENYVTYLESSFTFVQDEKAATFNNAFGIEFKGLDKDIIESVTVNGAKATLENNPNPSIIVATNARTAIGNTYTVLFTLKKNNTLDETTVDYNPFIVENNDGSAPQRKEVHLPKQTPTSLGWNEGNINQYYVDGWTGAYPFAIDIPKLNWELVTEGIAIGSKNGEYPTFRNWADSNGQTYTDWYNHK